MRRIGLFCFLGRGHLDPALGLGRCLMQRGHQVTIFHIAMAAAAVRSSGLRFRDIDRHESAAGDRQARWFKWRDTLDALKTHATRVLREGREAVRAEGIDALIVDQSDLAGGSIAESLNIPFVTLCCAPPMYLHDRVPPPVFGWGEARSPLGMARNRLANWVVSRATRPLLKDINRRRREWGLATLRHVNDTFSELGIVTQLPSGLDFEARPRAPLFHVGPLRDAEQVFRRGAFPWDRLNGKPMVYASMGTIRNRVPWVFRCIAEACSGFDVQLVLSLGGGPVRPEHLGSLPGDPIVVHYAPQAELILSASLVINCAGLNTTLDAVKSGVPLVVIPVAEDQPGVAARIRKAGIGAVVPYRRLSTRKLTAAIRTVLEDPAYRSAVRVMERELDGRKGAEEAATLMERLFAGWRGQCDPSKDQGKGVLCR